MSGHEHGDLNPESPLPRPELTMSAAPIQRSSGTANLVMALGVLSLGFGIALTFAPVLSWKLVGVARTLFRFGYEATAFTWAGLGFLAVGGVGRALLARTQEGDDVGILADQIAFEFEELKGSMVHMSEAVTQLTSTQQALFQRQEALEGDAGTEKEKNYDAVFRLAASLDQLSARLDQRVSSLATEIQQRTGGVVERVQEGRAALELELRNQARTQTQTIAEAIQNAIQRAAADRHPAQPVPAQPIPVQQEAPPVPPAPPAPEPQAQAPSDDVHIYVDLEEEAPVSEIGQEILGKLGSIEPALPSEPPAPQQGQPSADTGGLYGAPSEREDLDSLLPDEALRRVLDDDHNPS